MNVCVWCVWICLCECVCESVSVCECVCVSGWVWIFMCGVRECVWVCVWMCVCECVWMCVCEWVCVNIHVWCAWMCVSMGECVCLCDCLCVVCVNMCVWMCVWSVWTCVWVFVNVCVCLCVVNRLHVALHWDWGRIPEGPKYFCSAKRPHQFWGPPSLLYKRNNGSLLGVKRPRRGVGHQPPYTADVKEGEEPYLYSLSGTS